jgi:hypothetical protein
MEISSTRYLIFFDETIFDLHYYRILFACVKNTQRNGIIVIFKGQRVKR